MTSLKKPRNQKVVNDSPYSSESDTPVTGQNGPNLMAAYEEEKDYVKNYKSPSGFKGNKRLEGKVTLQLTMDIETIQTL